MTAPTTPKPPRKKPKTAATAKPVAPRKEATLHPRNRHTGRYDFPALIKTTPELATVQQTIAPTPAAFSFVSCGIMSVSVGLNVS